MNSKVIKNALDFDPIAEAEDMLGEKMNQDNFGLGLAFVQDKRAMVNRLMSQTGDVCSDTSFSDYLRIALDFGFRSVYEERFLNYQREGQDETFMVLWHDKGFLLALESYTWKPDLVRVNTAKLYYNVKISTDRIPDFFRECVSSGWFARHHANGDDTNVWTGDHDVRDALKYRMSRLMEHEPLAKWVEAPYLWLINFSESHDSEKTPWPERSNQYDAINRAKIEKLPVELRDMIKGCMK